MQGRKVVAQPLKTGQPVQQTQATKPVENKTLAQQFQKVTDHKRLPKEMRDQFLKRIQFCSNQYDLNDTNKHVKEKKERLIYLQELSELLNEPSSVQSLFIPHLDLIIEMIEKNIFRPLPILKNNGTISEPGAEDEEVYVNPEWEHIEPILDFFLQLIVNEAIDVRMLKGFVTHSFVQDFLELFHSEEPREREYLKNILHKLYAKLVPRRKLIRRAINDSFYTLIHENYKFAGAAELLDILAAIISGFAVPLREEHILFFKNVIIPLHKVQTCLLYHEQLMRCSMLFLSKDPTLAFPLLEGILRYWPFANSTKETVFLQELLEVIEVCDCKRLDNIIPKLFKRIVKCIAGSHLQVADRAMCFFENEFFLNVVRNFKSYTFPLLVPVISQLADNHWHKILKDSFLALKNILKEIDYQSYEKALNQKTGPFLAFITDGSKDRQKLDDKWKKLSTLAKQKNPNFVDPVLPYIDSHIVGEHNGLNNKHVLSL